MKSKALLTITLLATAARLGAQNAQADEFFEKKVRPVFAKSCAGCHNAKVKTAGLDLTTAEGFAHGGQSGVLVSKQDPAKSLLMRVVGYEESLKMPPTGKLKDEEIADLRTWVEAGGAFPGATATGPAAAHPANSREFTEAEKKFWAFQPLTKPAVPTVKDQTWVRTPVDNFILAKLEEKGLKPAPKADKLTLLRRVTYDVTGLPPTEEEIKNFLADKSPDAYAKVVDRLLASPRYGEQWGRHWLDIARYADSTGNDEDHRYPYAWRYRDYVISAFNQDMPFDQFVREQVAGDLLPTNEPGGVNRRGIIATGFLALGPKALAQPDKQKMLYDVYDEQVDVISKSLLGITVACARCHDHKFDPILTKDYYSMVSIFANTKDFASTKGVAKMVMRPLVPKEEYDRYKAAEQVVAAKSMAIDELSDQPIEKYTAELVPRLADYMVAARKVYESGADAKRVAVEQGLKEDVLDRWVKFLKPSPEARPHLEQWQAAKPDMVAAVAREYQKRFEEQQATWTKTMDKWRERVRKMTAEKNMPPPERPKFDRTKDEFFYQVSFDGPFSVAKADREKLIPEEIKLKLAELKKERDALKAALPPEPDMADSVEEGPAVEQKVFIRGDYNSPGPDAPKAFPLIVAGYEQQPKVVKGSGRLELAEWLSSPKNQLTPRVITNRIWQWHFGEGIVRTPDNFGKMGERPTHPELLDYLSSRFLENGWSIKSMHKLILLSNAYQMSSNVLDATVEADPENHLFSRFPRRRLSVEEIRDGLLAIDGSIDLTMGGTLQTGFGTDGENSDGRLSLRPESNPRRMVYLPLRRANLPSLLNLFDFGDATTSQGKRANTTIAPQALFMMNSDFITERAKKLSESALKAQPDANARLRALYVKVLNREPEPDELDAGLTYLSSFQKKFAAKRTESDAWFSLCRVLISSNEFVYLD
jgi:uncharacterized protein YeaO (DUF488 family)/mono/diheme cytochrome c family protein